MKYIPHPDIPKMYREATNEFQNMGRRLGRTLNTPGPSGVSMVDATKMVVKAVAHIPASIFDSSTLKKKK